MEGFSILLVILTVTLLECTKKIKFIAKSTTDENERLVKSILDQCRHYNDAQTTANPTEIERISQSHLKDGRPKDTKFRKTSAWSAREEQRVFMRDMMDISDDRRRKYPTVPQNEFLELQQQIKDLENWLKRAPANGCSQCKHNAQISAAKEQKLVEEIIELKVKSTRVVSQSPYPNIRYYNTLRPTNEGAQTDSVPTGQKSVKTPRPTTKDVGTETETHGQQEKLTKDKSSVSPFDSESPTMVIGPQPKQSIDDPEPAANDHEPLLSDPEVPVNKPEPPINEPESPVNDVETLLKDPELPLNDPELPINGPESPINDLVLPANDPELPVDEPFTPPRSIKPEADPTLPRYTPKSSPKQSLFPPREGTNTKDLSDSDSDSSDDDDPSPDQSRVLCEPANAENENQNNDNQFEDSSLNTGFQNLTIATHLDTPSQIVDLDPSSDTPTQRSEIDYQSITNPPLVPINFTPNAGEAAAAPETVTYDNQEGGENDIKGNTDGPNFQVEANVNNEFIEAPEEQAETAPATTFQESEAINVQGQASVKSDESFNSLFDDPNFEFELPPNQDDNPLPDFDLRISSPSPLSVVQSDGNALQSEPQDEAMAEVFDYTETQEPTQQDQVMEESQEPTQQDQVMEESQEPYIGDYYLANVQPELTQHSYQEPTESPFMSQYRDFNVDMADAPQEGNVGYRIPLGYVEASTLQETSNDQNRVPSPTLIDAGRNSARVQAWHQSHNTVNQQPLHQPEPQTETQPLPSIEQQEFNVESPFGYLDTYRPSPFSSNPHFTLRDSPPETTNRALLTVPNNNSPTYFDSFTFHSPPFNASSRLSSATGLVNPGALAGQTNRFHTWSLAPHQNRENNNAGQATDDTEQDEPEATESEAAESESSRSSTDDTEVIESKANGSEANDGEASGSDAEDPGADGSEIAEPKADESDTEQPKEGEVEEDSQPSNDNNSISDISDSGFDLSAPPPAHYFELKDPRAASAAAEYHQIMGSIRQQHTEIQASTSKTLAAAEETRKAAEKWMKEIAEEEQREKEAKVKRIPLWVITERMTNPTRRSSEYIPAPRPYPIHPQIGPAPQLSNLQTAFPPQLSLPLSAPPRLPALIEDVPTPPSRDAPPATPQLPRSRRTWQPRKITRSHTAALVEEPSDTERAPSPPLPVIRDVPVPPSMPDTPTTDSRTDPNRRKHPKRKRRSTVPTQQGLANYTYTPTGTNVDNKHHREIAAQAAAVTAQSDDVASQNLWDAMELENAFKEEEGTAQQGEPVSDQEYTADDGEDEVDYT